MGQRIFIGYGVVDKLKGILDYHSPGRILLVTGGKSYHTSNAENILKNELASYDYHRFHEFHVNPALEDTLRGLEVFNEQKCDFVIGIGGGSVMDMAKSVAIASGNNNLHEVLTSGKPLHHRKVPTVMIPTTAGTGSESTHYSVIYIDKRKYSLSHLSMLPDYAILDPVFTDGLPERITAITGMDALSQGIEAHWSINSTVESRSLSRKAIKLIIDNIIPAVNNPNGSHRLNMLKGSNLAGGAINIARTTAPHSVSYPMTAYFNVPHGHAVALTLPFFFPFNHDVDESSLQEPRGVNFVRSRLREIFKILGVAGPEEAKDCLHNIMGAIHLETRLSLLGIQEVDLDIIIRNGFNEQRMKNNPREVGEEQLRNIILAIL